MPRWRPPATSAVLAAQAKLFALHSEALAQIRIDAVERVREEVPTPGFIAVMLVLVIACGLFGEEESPTILPAALVGGILSWFITWFARTRRLKKRSE